MKSDDYVYYSPRELEVAALVREGMTDEEISDELGMRPDLADRYRGLLSEKADLQRRMDQFIETAGLADG